MKRLRELTENREAWPGEEERTNSGWDGREGAFELIRHATGVREAGLPRLRLEKGGFCEIEVVEGRNGEEWRICPWLALSHIIWG